MKKFAYYLGLFRSEMINIKIARFKPSGTAVNVGVKHLIVYCVAFIFGNCYAFGNSLAISGPSTVCVDNTVEFEINTPNGINYDWSATGPAHFSSSTGNELNVQWTNDGYFSVSVVVFTSEGETLFYSKSVTVNKTPNPVITSSFDSDCGDPVPRVLSRGWGMPITDKCLLACLGSTVTYSVEQNAGSTYNWTIPSNHQYTDYGSSVEINWSTPGNFIIGVEEVSSDGCTGYAKACIEILNNPIASFSTNPAASNDTVYICKNQTLFVESTSSTNGGSDLMTWFWDFGDGYVGNGEFSSHKYSIPGTFDLQLIVENECHCKDTANVVVNVSNSIAAEIECPGVVCSGDTVVYYTTDSCSSYNWSVIGGTFSTNVNTDQILDSIRVIWGAPSNGMGGITLDNTACGLGCASNSTIYIPIIVDNVDIKGKSTVCKGTTSKYSVPNYPGSTYQWGTVGYNGGVYDGGNESEVEIWWNNTGSEIVEVTYYNEFLDCGGSSQISVGIKEELELTVEEKYCDNGSVEFSVLPTTGSFDWQVWDFDNNVVYPRTGGSSSLTIDPWGHGPGIFRVRVYDDNNDFCVDWVEEYFEVLPAPPKPSKIEGPRNICPEELASYYIDPTSPEYFIEWDIVGGSPGTASGNSVNVRWNQASPWQLSAKQIRRNEPRCESDTILLTVTQKPSIQPNIIGETEVCANTEEIYQSDVTNASSYDWTIIPDYAGSVAEGNGSEEVLIQWNDYVGLADISLTTKVCGVEKSNALQVNVVQQPTVTITSPSNACQFDVVNLSTTTTGTEYQWDFGDGNTESTTQNSVSHIYTEDGTFSITLEVVSPEGCQGSSSASSLIQIKPAPVASITTADETEYCTTPNVTLYVAVQGQGATTYTYDWRKLGSSATLWTGTTYQPTTHGTYYAVVTDPVNGCSSETNTIDIVKDCGSQGTTCEIDGTIDFSWSIQSPSCAVVNFQEQLSSKGRVLEWQVMDPAASNPKYYSKNPTHEFSSSGYYPVKLKARFPSLNSTPDSCDEVYSEIVEIPIYADFSMEITCGTGNNYDVNIIDQSDHLPGYGIGDWEWYIDGTPQTNYNNLEDFTIPLNAGESYQIKLVIRDIASTEECEITKTLTLPAKPVASFTGPDNSCVDVPTVFNNESTGEISSYHWDFGDGATLKKEFGVRAYTEPNASRDVVLTIEGNYGCIDSYTKNIEIVSNLITKKVIAEPDSILCKGEKVNLIFTTEFPQDTTDFNYLWLQNGSEYASTKVKESGYYYLNVYDVNNCKSKFRSPSILFEHPPFPVIEGETDICIQENANLSAYAGSQYDYTWIRNGSVYSTTPEISSYESTPGPVTFEAIITDPANGCSDTSEPFIVTVHDKPGLPQISSSRNPACGPAYQELTASSSGAIYYQWNTGQIGPTIPVYEAGTYAVNASNEFGCISGKLYSLKAYPDFSKLLTGCFEKCDSLFPFTIPGITGSFSSYFWYKDEGVIQSGSGTIPDLSIPGPGVFYLVADIDGCVDTSDFLTIYELDCTPDQICDSFSLALNSVFCTGDYSPDSIVYSLNLNLNSNLTETGFNIFSSTSTEGNVKLNTSSQINAGNNFLNFTYTDTSPLSDSACIYIYLADSLGDTCMVDLCFEVPPCDTNSGICFLNLNLAPYKCIGQLSGSNENQYLFDLSINNPSSNIYSFHLITNNGELSSIHTETGLIEPGVNLVTGIYTKENLWNGDLCIDLILMDTASNEVISCQVCAVLPTCGTSNPCQFESIDKEIVNVGINSTGKNVIFFDIGFISNVEGDLYVESNDGDIIFVQPNNVSIGENGIQGFFITPNTTSACLDLIVYIEATASWCRTSVCFVIPVCNDTINECIESFHNGGFDYLSCNGVNLNGEHSFSWNINVSPNHEDWYVYAESTVGDISNVSPAPLLRNHQFISGYGFSIPPSTGSYCINLLFVNKSTFEVCERTFCTNFPCSETGWVSE